MGLQLRRAGVCGTHRLSPVRGSTIAVLKRGTASPECTGISASASTGVCVCCISREGVGVTSGIKGVTYSQLQFPGNSKETGLKDTGLGSPLHLPTHPVHYAGKITYVWLTPVTGLLRCVCEKKIQK